ncbi:GTP-binding nuclear protein Ran-like isoform X2 [Oratosquilla oratoria]|uniref:GTP-binding nuclear protein Ran-like isoform X2 n=1 Tax=Oratosquilla oratoria TaxID=337810 RepID=UPI003F764119
MSDRLKLRNVGSDLNHLLDLYIEVRVVEEMNPEGKEQGKVSEADSSTTNKQTRFKIVVVGDGATGKTSFIARHDSEDFMKEYVATMGVEKTEVTVESTHGEFTLVFWDTAGQEKVGPLRDGYYKEADAAIIMFDMTSRTTYKNVPNWHRDITKVCESIPIVLCANKTDVKEKKLKSKNLTYAAKNGLGLYEISVKDRVNLVEPLNFLLQRLVLEPELKIHKSLDTSFLTTIDKMGIQC